MVVNSSERRQQAQQRPERNRLDNESLPFLAHDGLFARKLKLAGDSDGLVSAILEKYYVPERAHICSMTYVLANAYKGYSANG